MKEPTKFAYHGGIGNRQYIFPLHFRDCVRDEKNATGVMLSAVKHLDFSVIYKDEILRTMPSPIGMGEGAQFRMV